MSTDQSGHDFTRRDLIKLTTAAALAAPLGIASSLAAQTPAAAPSFFTPAELALVDELSELIVPTDDHSPGAKAANVAAYIGARLAEAPDEKDRTDWRGGLRLVEEMSQQTGGKSFLQATPAERIAVLTRMAQNESNPEKPEEHFFVELKSRVVQAYYSSEIGIKQEMGYQGNSYLPEFVGTDVSR